MAERGPDLERQQSKAVLPMEEHCLHAIQELSSCMQKHNSLVMELLKEQSTRMEDLSSRMEELSSQIKELTSRTEDQPFLSSDGLSAITQLEVFHTTASLQNKRGITTLHPEELPDLPIYTACATAVIIGRKVYVCGGRCLDVDAGRQVHVYCLDEKTWTTLPELTPQYRCEAIAINNQLVLIGGCEAPRTITNMVSTWTEQGWRQDIPAMPTKRMRPGVIMYDKCVIVAGGMAESNRALLSSVDILDTSKRQWWTPANFQLPLPMCAQDIAVCSSGMYVAAAIIDVDITNNEKTPSNDAWQLPLGVLEEVLTTKKDTPPEPYQWIKIASTPNNHSTLVKSSIHPVAIGGAVKGDRSGCNSTRNISVYDPILNRWSILSQLLEPRARCAVACVSKSSLLVCGGYSDTCKDPKLSISSVELLNYHR